MKTKIKLSQPASVVITAPGEQPAARDASDFELRQLTVDFGGDTVQRVTALLTPLGEDGKPIPYAQPYRKIMTAGEALAWGSVAEAGLKKLK